MTNTIESTNNPLVILACLLALALTALLRTAARLAGAVLYATGRTVANHWRLLALLALPVVAVVLVNLAWPVLVAVAGKALVGGGATMAFAMVFKP